MLGKVIQIISFDKFRIELYVLVTYSRFYIAFKSENYSLKPFPIRSLMLISETKQSKSSA